MQSRDPSPTEIAEFGEMTEMIELIQSREGDPKKWGQNVEYFLRYFRKVCFFYLYLVSNNEVRNFVIGKTPHFSNWIFTKMLSKLFVGALKQSGKNVK